MHQSPSNTGRKDLLLLALPLLLLPANTVFFITFMYIFFHILYDSLFLRFWVFYKQVVCILLQVCLLLVKYKGINFIFCQLFAHLHRPLYFYAAYVIALLKSIRRELAVARKEKIRSTALKLPKLRLTFTQAQARRGGKTRYCQHCHCRSYPRTPPQKYHERRNHRE